MNPGEFLGTSQGNGYCRVEMGTGDMSQCKNCSHQNKAPNYGYSHNCEGLNFVDQNRPAAKEHEKVRANELRDNLIYATREKRIR